MFRAEKLLELSAGIGPVLGLDTASATASIAIASHGRILAEVTRSASSHGAELPRAVDEALAQAGIALKDLSGIAVGLGPGSYTGLRVGIAYAKGLVLALGCALIGIPSFDCVALAASERAEVLDGALIATIFDARKGEIYANFYRARPDRLDKNSEPLIITLQNLFTQLSSGAILVGDSKAREASLLLSERGIESTVIDEVELNSRGRYVAALGAEGIARGAVAAPA
ncbi:MAG TPA: tRNA (adenosine(37)-N6)-threonylcarbamoyltransferase complex dimerization subunit type 1 TsaB, partial [Candidatus Binataceae bacterium]|nr:tRNA (adenosine(37)-N6)-threonylcarbamoyltransferase complex dimerization subunit type 1 TsaB [Candidatus Binataceae bacterium]